MRKHIFACQTSLRLRLCKNRLVDSPIDVQLAAIEVTATSKPSSVHRPAQEESPSAGRLQFANRQSRHSSPLTAQSCEQDADPWGSLVDPESPGMPSSPRADASSPPCHTADLLCGCRPPGLMHAAQEPYQGSDTGQQPEQAATNPELMTHPTSEGVVANQMPFAFKHHKHVHAEFGGQQHHSADSRDLSWELVEQQKQAASAGQQLQWQLQKSQQHLLRCQENHKQCIAAAFGQAVQSEVSDQPHEQQKQQPGAKLAAGRCQASSDGSRAQQQEQQQKQLQLKCAKHAQQRQRAEPDASAEAKTEAGYNLGNMYQKADMHSGRLPDFLSGWTLLLLLSYLVVTRHHLC